MIYSEDKFYSLYSWKFESELRKELKGFKHLL